MNNVNIYSSMLQLEFYILVDGKKKKKAIMNQWMSMQKNYDFASW